jgi:hypothetical protein
MQNGFGGSAGCAEVRKLTFTKSGHCGSIFDGLCKRVKKVSGRPSKFNKREGHSFLYLFEYSLSMSTFSCFINPGFFA